MHRPARLATLPAIVGLLGLLILPNGFLNALQPTARAAAAFIVNSGDDTPDAAPGNGVCANALGSCTLRAAIGEANSLAGDDTINISTTGTINLRSGQLDITSNITINGPGSNLLTLRGGDTAHRIFFVNAPAVAISGMTVRNGIGPSPSGAGGGIQNAGALTLTDVVVTDNQAGSGGSGSTNGGSGGGIDNSGTLTMTNCVVSNNFSGSGTLGATSSEDGSGGRGAGINNTGTLTVTNCTISGNRVQTGPRPGDNLGGGIYNGGTLTLTNVTIGHNSGAGAAGVFNAGTANVKNTIIAPPRFVGIPDVAGPFNSLGHNLVGDAGTSTGFTDKVNGDIVGTATAPVNPLLSMLFNYGGPSPTHALLPGSPAINAGTSDGAPAQDQRGVGRVGAVDIGSFESRGFSIAATGGTPQSAVIRTTFGSPLRATVSSAFGEPVSGGRVTFSAPLAGPSATFASGATAVVQIFNAGDVTTPQLTANGVAGSYQLTAAANGISNVATYSLTNTQAPTTTSVTSSVNPSNFGQSVTFTAVVASTGGTPTGTVQFKANGVDLGDPIALTGSGRVSFTTSALASGAHNISAVYSGDANFLPSEGTLAGGQRVRPTLSINDISMTEGDGGTTNAVFTLTLSSPADTNVTVSFLTMNGTATAPADYQASTGGTFFETGQTTRTVTVAVHGDTSFEPDETFFVDLSGVSGATLARGRGVGTILNDDPEGGRLRFASATFSTNEGSGSATITVERTGDTSRAVTVDYETSDLTASQRSDYNLTLGTLSFAAGETSKTFAVLINQDSFVEGTEALSLTLSHPGNQAGLGNVASATLEISDDVPETTANPLDAPGSFVRQHYHDFLNREPDPEGLAFWTNDIEVCGADLQCREVKRINVSAAFFLSIEFQETGYFVYRLHKAAYGDATSPNVEGTVPVIRLREFMADSRRTGEGVVVGKGEWREQMEAKKNAFALEFVRRQRFKDAFPASMNADEFVPGLDRNQGLLLSGGERSQLRAAPTPAPSD